MTTVFTIFPSFLSPSILVSSPSFFHNNLSNCFLSIFGLCYFDCYLCYLKRIIKLKCFFSSSSNFLNLTSLVFAILIAIFFIQYIFLWFHHFSIFLLSYLIIVILIVIFLLWNIFYFLFQSYPSTLNWLITELFN